MGATFSELIAAMGIDPPSFYAAFGSKEQPFRRAGLDGGFLMEGPMASITLGNDDRMRKGLVRSRPIRAKH